MEISGINNVSFSQGIKENDDKDTGNIREFTPKPVDASAADALDSAGRAQVIKMPKRKMKPQSVEEVCDFYIAKNNTKLKALKTAPPVITPNGYNSTDSYIKEYERQNRNLEILKGLDNEKFLNKLNPNKHYMWAATEFDGDEDMLRKNVDALNGMDERVISKIKYHLLAKVLEAPNLEERGCELSKCDDEILEKLSKGAVMDYLCETELFSKTEESAELANALFEIFDALPPKARDAVMDGRMTFDTDKVKKDFLNYKAPDVVDFVKPEPEDI